jgi:hypothetical protein
MPCQTIEFSTPTKTALIHNPCNRFYATLYCLMLKPAPPNAPFEFHLPRRTRMDIPQEIDESIRNGYQRDGKLVISSCRQKISPKPLKTPFYNSTQLGVIGELWKLARQVMPLPSTERTRNILIPIDPSSWFRENFVCITVTSARLSKQCRQPADDRPGNHPRRDFPPTPRHHRQIHKIERGIPTDLSEHAPYASPPKTRFDDNTSNNVLRLR